jgi:acetate---CoA ligase (ADP-forming)
VLDALFNPRSVAIIGASNDPNKVGGRPLAFLRQSAWSGKILPINPVAETVQGLTAFASLEAIEGPIDSAIIALPAGQVLAAGDQCLARGVKALQIFSADVKGAALQAFIHRARAHGARVLGPNSLGLFNVSRGYFGTFATALDGAWPVPGPVGVATQSGAVGSYFFGMAQARGVGLSHFVATGNEADVDVADCIAFMAADPATRLIVTAIEGCKDGRKLIAAISKAREAGKPVLAMKVGASAAGARAAATHTGSLSGEDRVFDAALRHAGAVRLHSLEALVDAAVVASTEPVPACARLLVVTTSGGVGVVCADAAQDAKLELPEISATSHSAITGLVPLAEGANPVDTSAAILGDLSQFVQITEQAMKGLPQAPGAALLYIAHIARNPKHWAQLREPLLAWRAGHPELCVVAVGLMEPLIESDLRDHHIAVFQDPTRAVAAIGACARSGELQPGKLLIADQPGASATSLLSSPIANESQAQNTLGSLGIPFAPKQLVSTADEAAQAARELGYPVVIKIVSPDIAHKSEVGGVVVGIHDEPGIRTAISEIVARVRALQPTARLEGFLVAKELRGGVEMLVGTQRDPAFGAVLTVAAGGVLTEVLQDAQTLMAPASHAQVLHALGQLRSARLLRGYRGGQACDSAALAALAVRLSEIAAQHPAIESIDLNPVLCTPQGAWALDALIATSQEKGLT